MPRDCCYKYTCDNPECGCSKMKDGIGLPIGWIDVSSESATNISESVPEGFKQRATIPDIAYFCCPKCLLDYLEQQFNQSN